MSALMARRSPELCAFQKNYQILLSLRFGISTISTKAFATGLISQDLRDKCSNQSLSESDRTKCLLDALEDKMQYVPSTLKAFVGILNETSSFEFIGDQVQQSLKEEELKQQTHAVEQQLGCQFPPGRALSGKTISFNTLEEAKKELLSVAKELKIQAMLNRRQCSCGGIGDSEQHYCNQSQCTSQQLKTEERSASSAANPLKIKMPQKSTSIAVPMVRSPSLSSLTSPFFTMSLPVRLRSSNSSTDLVQQRHNSSEASEAIWFGSKQGQDRQFTDNTEKLFNTTSPLSKSFNSKCESEMEFPFLARVTRASDPKVEGLNYQDLTTLEIDHGSLGPPTQDQRKMKPLRLKSHESIDSDIFFTPSGSLSDESFKEAKEKSKDSVKCITPQEERWAKFAREIHSLKRQQSKTNKQTMELKTKLEKQVQQNQALETELAELRDKVEKVEQQSAETVQTVHNSLLNSLESYSSTDAPQDQEIDDDGPKQTFLHFSHIKHF